MIEGGGKEGERVKERALGLRLRHNLYHIPRTHVREHADKYFEWVACSLYTPTRIHSLKRARRKVLFKFLFTHARTHAHTSTQIEKET